MPVLLCAYVQAHTRGGSETHGNYQLGEDFQRLSSWNPHSASGIPWTYVLPGSHLVGRAGHPSTAQPPHLIVLQLQSGALHLLLSQHRIGHVHLGEGRVRGLRVSCMV